MIFDHNLFTSTSLNFLPVSTLKYLFIAHWKFLYFLALSLKLHYYTGNPDGDDDDGGGDDMGQDANGGSWGRRNKSLGIGFRDFRHCLHQDFRR